MAIDTVRTRIINAFAEFSRQLEARFISKEDIKGTYVDSNSVNDKDVYSAKAINDEIVGDLASTGIKLYKENGSEDLEGSRNVCRQLSQLNSNLADRVVIENIEFGEHTFVGGDPSKDHDYSIVPSKTGYRILMAQPILYSSSNAWADYYAVAMVNYSETTVRVGIKNTSSNTYTWRYGARVVYIKNLNQ